MPKPKLGGYVESIKSWGPAWFVSMPEVEQAHLDAATQVERCRRLEMAVLVQALVDAAWRPPSDYAEQMKYRQGRARMRNAELRRLEVRNWFLDRDLKHREHIEAIADAAGMPEGYIWRLVERFLVDGEDPAPLHSMHATLIDPVRRATGVAFVA